MFLHYPTPPPKKIFFLKLIFFLTSGTFLEATQTEQFHGSASIYSGSVVIVRNLENLIFNTSDSPVEIQEGDLMQVGVKGNLRLNFRSGDRITHGSNAILQV